MQAKNLEELKARLQNLKTEKKNSAALALSELELDLRQNLDWKKDLPRKRPSVNEEWSKDLNMACMLLEEKLKMLFLDSEFHMLYLLGKEKTEDVVPVIISLSSILKSFLQKHSSEEFIGLTEARFKLNAQDRGELSLKLEATQLEVSIFKQKADTFFDELKLRTNLVNELCLTSFTDMEVQHLRFSFVLNLNQIQRKQNKTNTNTARMDV